jgi:hypothetical protein
MPCSDFTERKRSCVLLQLEMETGRLFTDPGLLALCKAIEKKDLFEIDRLVTSGVDVNASSTLKKGQLRFLCNARACRGHVFSAILMPTQA